MFQPSMYPWWNQKKFKPVGGRYEPVPGGRWGVRYLPHGRYDNERGRRNLPWSAWTTGKAVRYSMWFATHEEAINWAQTMAYLWRFKKFGQMDDMKSELLESRKKAKVKAFRASREE